MAFQYAYRIISVETDWTWSVKATHTQGGRDRKETFCTLEEAQKFVEYLSTLGINHPDAK